MSEGVSSKRAFFVFRPSSQNQKGQIPINNVLLWLMKYDLNLSLITKLKAIKSI